MITMIMAALASVAYVVLVVVTRKEGRIIRFTVWLYGPMILGLWVAAVVAAK